MMAAGYAGFGTVRRARYGDEDTVRRARDPRTIVSEYTPLQLLRVFDDKSRDDKPILFQMRQLAQIADDPKLDNALASVSADSWGNEVAYQ